MNQYHFTCDLCSQISPSEMEHFAPADDWLKTYPERQLAHVHFGHSIPADDTHTEETQWIHNYMFQFFDDHPGLKMCALVDMILSDDSEAPSAESMRLYKEILNHPQLELVIFYGSSSGMIFFLKMLMQFVSKRVKIVHTKAEADALYEEWLLGTTSGR